MDWEDLMGDLAEGVLGRVIGKVDDLIGSFVGDMPDLPPHMHPHYQGPGRGYSADTSRKPRPGSGQTHHSRRRRAPDPEPDAPLPPEPPREGPNPREVLGFPEGSKPSKKEIKERQRAFAAIFHPDKGGDTFAMQRVNAAVQDLIKELGYR